MMALPGHCAVEAHATKRPVNAACSTIKAFFSAVLSRQALATPLPPHLICRVRARPILNPASIMRCRMITFCNGPLTKAAQWVHRCKRPLHNGRREWAGFWGTLASQRTIRIWRFRPTRCARPGSPTVTCTRTMASVARAPTDQGLIVCYPLSFPETLSSCGALTDWAALSSISRHWRRI